LRDRRKGWFEITGTARTYEFSPHFSHCNLVLQRIIWFSRPRGEERAVSWR
jgi:hypothetical protein